MAATGEDSKRSLEKAPKSLPKKQGWKLFFMIIIGNSFPQEII